MQGAVCPRTVECSPVQSGTVIRQIVLATPSSSADSRFCSVLRLPHFSFPYFLLSVSPAVQSHSFLSRIFSEPRLQISTVTTTTSRDVAARTSARKHLRRTVTDQTPPPRTKPPRSQPLSLLPYVGRLGSEPRLVSRIGSGVRVSASFRKKIPARFCPTAA